jgi:hypothetical protein
MLNPAEDSCMSQINTALCHHISRVAVAELVGDMPAGAQDDYGRIEKAAFE